MEIKSLKSALAELKDPRRTEGEHILHKMEDIMCMLLCSGEDFTDIDTFRRVLERIDEEKSNEITAVPELLDILNVAGNIVTADAMSCQKRIVQTIQDSQADYVIGLKGNQPTLLEEVSLYFQECSQELPSLVTRDKDHGRKAGIPSADGPVLASRAQRMGRTKGGWLCVLNCY